MTKAVLDTNLLVSAMLWGGMPRRVLDLAQAGRFSAVTSAELLSELVRILSTRFHMPIEEIDELLRAILSYSEVVDPKTSLKRAVRNSGDVKVLRLL